MWPNANNKMSKTLLPYNHTGLITHVNIIRAQLHYNFQIPATFFLVHRGYFLCIWSCPYVWITTWNIAEKGCHNSYNCIVWAWVVRSFLCPAHFMVATTEKSNAAKLQELCRDEWMCVGVPKLHTHTFWHTGDQRPYHMPLAHDRDFEPFCQAEKDSPGGVCHGTHPYRTVRATNYCDMLNLQSRLSGFVWTVGVVAQATWIL